MKFARSFLIPLAAFAFALALCAGFVALSGQSPMVAASALLQGALGTSSRRAETLSKTIPLVMTGLGVALCFRAGFWNIGAEGQFAIGALAATALGTRAPAPFSNVVIVLIGGALAGATWALLAGLLKTRRGAPEIITTIMLNYIALQIVTFAVQGPLQERAREQPQSDVLPEAAQLPALIPDTSLHIGGFIALLCIGACWWLLFRTERGFLLRATGANAIAARASGIRVERQTLFATGLGGALCGLGGAMEIAGATKQLGLSPFGYGYTAIAVALLAKNHPLSVLPAALFFGILSAGGGAMERTANVPAVTVSIVTGVLIFVVTSRSGLRSK